VPFDGSFRVAGREGILLHLPYRWAKLPVFSATATRTAGRHIMEIKRLFSAAVLVGLVGFAAGAALAQPPDPLVGTWKLNVAKSTGSAFKSGTSKIEKTAAGVKFTVDLVRDDGTTSHWSFTANYDGKDNPVTGSSPYGDMVALERVDARTTRIVSKKNGKVTTTQTIVVSPDGKTRTTTTKGTDASGAAIDSVAFYEKQ
jgi:hypothetical protein